MGLGVIAVLIHICHQCRPSTRCAKLSSISTTPHKQRTFEMGFGEIALLVHKFHQNRPSTRCAQLSSISSIPRKPRTFEMGLGEMAVLIHIFHHDRPSTLCAKLSSIPTIPHKPCTFEMGLGEMAVIIHIFHQNCLPPVVRNCPLFQPFHINHVRLRWDWVKWQSLFTYFIKIAFHPSCEIVLYFNHST